MAKSTQGAKLADINSPTPQPAADPRTGPTPSDRRNVSPTPQAEREGAHSEESVVDTAREAAAEKAREAKDAAAERARDQAENLREAGESFDPNSFAQAATDRLADTLSETARSIQGTDLAALGDDVASFARRQPLLFFGGAALLGFAAGRMLKASERAQHDEFATPYTSRRL